MWTTRRWKGFVTDWPPCKGGDSGASASTQGFSSRSWRSCSTGAIGSFGWSFALLLIAIATLSWMSFSLTGCGPKSRTGAADSGTWVGPILLSFRAAPDRRLCEPAPGEFVEAVAWVASAVAYYERTEGYTILPTRVDYYPDQLSVGLCAPNLGGCYEVFGNLISVGVGRFPPDRTLCHELHHQKLLVTTGNADRFHSDPSWQDIPPYGQKE